MTTVMFLKHPNQVSINPVSNNFARHNNYFKVAQISINDSKALLEVFSIQQLQCYGITWNSS